MTATATVEKTTIEKLSEGIFGAACGMHHREIDAAYGAIEEFLGCDVLAEQRRVEFNNLPAEEKDAMRAKRDFGIYGAYHMVTRPEVPVALTYAMLEEIRKEAEAEGGPAAGNRAVDKAIEEMQPIRRKTLRDEAMQTKITARFPDMTRERIKAALTVQ